MTFAPLYSLGRGVYAVQHGGMGKRVGRWYLTDVSDEEWSFVLPYLLLSREDNRSRQHSLRA